MKNKLSIHIFTTFSCILAAYFLAYSVIQLQNSTPTITPNRTATTFTNKQILPSISDFDIIVQRNIFNAHTNISAANTSMNIPSEMTPISDNLNSLPISQEPWKLLGTMMHHENDAQSRAIISIDGTQKTYKTADTIKSWKIQSIRRGSIILKQGAKTERLLLRNVTIQANVPTHHRKIQKAALQHVLQDPSALLQALQVAPYSAQNIHSLRVIAVNDDFLQNMLGIKANDLLLEINGNTLKDFGDLIQLSELIKQKTATLKLFRNGENLTIQYTIT